MCSQFVNDFHGLISPVPKGTPLPLALLGKVTKEMLHLLQQFFIISCFLLSFNFFCFVCYYWLAVSVQECSLVYFLVS